MPNKLYSAKSKFVRYSKMQEKGNLSQKKPNQPIEPDPKVKAKVQQILLEDLKEKINMRKEMKNIQK